jgi:hypothetical protein
MNYDYNPHKTHRRLGSLLWGLAVNAVFYLIILAALVKYLSTL